MRSLLTLFLTRQKRRNTPSSNTSLLPQDPQAPASTEPPQIKAASLQGLPNELQLEIIRLVWYNVMKDVMLIAPHLRGLYIRDLRCTVVALVSILPHHCSYFLGPLRVELMMRQWYFTRLHGQRIPTALKRFLMTELVTLKILVAWLETGDVKKLRMRSEMPKREYRRSTYRPKSIKRAFKPLWKS